MKAQEIPIESAVGLTLAYDLTGITPGKEKGAVLRRGHVIREDDLELLRAIGKSRVKILELAQEDVHEDDAALRLAQALAGDNIEVMMPGEAWADLIAAATVAQGRCRAAGNIEPPGRHSRRHPPQQLPGRGGANVARAKVRDLVVHRDVLAEAERVARYPRPIVQVSPFRAVRGGAVITGREIYERRKPDAFEPLLRRRLEDWGSTLDWVRIVRDEVPDISEAVKAAVGAGVDLVFVTGGGSPDDCTSQAIAACADEVAFHGVPVAPGAMSVLAYTNGVPILGVPGGLLARSRGFFDLILPGSWPASDREPRGGPVRPRRPLSALPTCVFPACPFGK
jgi:molybdopterin biosynthesis enzyme